MSCNFKQNIFYVKFVEMKHQKPTHETQPITAKKKEMKNNNNKKERKERNKNKKKKEGK